MAVRRIRLVRPDDLLVATVEIHNLVLAPDGSALVRVTPGEETSIVLRLPPQHFLEPGLSTALVEEFARTAPFTFGEFPLYAVPLAAGAGSFLSWRLADGVDRLELERGDGLLERLDRLSPDLTMYDVLVNVWWELHELPWVASPPPERSADGGTRHPLWHLRPAGDPGVTPIVAASMHWAVPQALDAAIATPDGTADYKLGVDLLKEAGLEGTVGSTISNPFPFFRRLFNVHRMEATALGGSSSFSGPLPAPGFAPPETAFTYEQRTSLGRDVYVRSSTWGWLSSGHRAVVTTIAERTIRSAHLLDFSGGGTETVSGAIETRAELVVPEPHLDLGALAGEYAFGGREMPFVSLALAPARVEVDVGMPPGPVTFLGSPVVFELTGVDRVGRHVPFRMPLVFIPDGVDPLAQLGGFMPGAGAPAAMAPTAVALASDAGRPPGSTSITVAAMTMAVVPARSRPFLPTLGSFSVAVDALAGITGRPPVMTASLHRAYLDSGLDRAANPLGAFLSIPSTRLDLPTAAIGGLGNPGGALDLITAERGAVAAALASGPPSPQQIADAFPLPKLLGTIDLRALLDANSFPRLPDGLPTTPVLSRFGPPGAEVLEYRFEARLSRQAPPPAIVVAEGARLTLHSRVARGPGGGPSVTSHGVVTGIGFELAGFMRLTFREVRFATDAGGKTRVDIVGTEVVFLGALEFLAEIARRLGGLAGGGGPRVDVDARGVTAGFELAIPSLSLGALELSNLSVSAFLRVPFESGSPLSFSLDVAKRSRPFRATVSMFGGGGYLSLQATPKGIVGLEAAVEFGGSVSLDIVVASGGVSVMAGIFFAMKIEGDTRTLAANGFVRASGQLTVLGIVSIFVEFRLELGYREIDDGVKKRAMFAGTASVTVGVRVLFFSKSVTLTVTREFIGSATDPGFAECIDHDDWREYCSAFAGAGQAPAVAPSAFGGAP